MKKFLFVAVAALFSLAACNSPKAQEANAAQEPATVATNANEDDAPATTGKIASFYMDVVLSNYQMALDLQAQFQKEYEAKDKELSASARKIEKDFNTLQDKVNKVLITRADAEKEAAKLQKRQADLQQRSEKAMAELAEKEQVMTNQILNAIYTYVAELNKDWKYDMVLSSSAAGGPVVMANPSLDLTAQIIEGLNAQYTASK